MIKDRGHLEATGLTPGEITFYEEELTFTSDIAEPLTALKQTASGSVIIPRFSAAGKRLLKEAAEVKKPDHRFSRFQGELRSGQVPGVKNAISILKAHRGCTVVADPGSGKTVVALKMASVLGMPRVVILVDQINLLTQWIERIQQFLPQAAIGVMAADNVVRKVKSSYDLNGTRGKIVIATAQSLSRKDNISVDKPLKTDLLICDEAHAFSAPSFVEAINKISFHTSIALTATPDRRDGMEGVFMSYLGDKTVKFSGETLNPNVLVIRAPDGGVDLEDWKRSWCRRNRSMTTWSACQRCIHVDNFPDCGGGIGYDASTGRAIWGDQIDFGGMVSHWCDSDEMFEWYKQAIFVMIKSDRNAFFFATHVNILVKLYEWTESAYPGKAGLYVGTSSCPKEYKGQLKTSLQKSITFATYRKAAKGLDVKEKDALILGSPIRDARQVIGRVCRTSPGKTDTFVIIPDSPVPVFKAMLRHVTNWVKEKGWNLSQR